jgi:hypothetical protein
MPDAKSKLSWKRSILPLTLLLLGGAFASIQLLYNAGSYMKSLFISVNHPKTYSFELYDRLLFAHVKEGLVDYAELAKRSDQLSQAVEQLSRTSPDQLATEEDTLCFWVNAHNLLVLKTIVDHYPLKSVEKISDHFGLSGFVVGGKTYTVSRIEEQEIRPRLNNGDVRVLFTICGGARGDPFLQNHAFTPARLNADLDHCCRQFVLDSNNVYLDPDIDTLFLSPLFKWNERLLEKDFDSPFDFANHYLPVDKAVNLESIHIKKAYFTKFNWWLNDTALGPIVPRRPAGEDSIDTHGALNALP